MNFMNLLVIGTIKNMKHKQPIKFIPKRIQWSRMGFNLQGGVGYALILKPPTIDLNPLYLFKKIKRRLEG